MSSASIGRYDNVWLGVVFDYDEEVKDALMALPKSCRRWLPYPERIWVVMSPYLSQLQQIFKDHDYTVTVAPDIFPKAANGNPFAPLLDWPGISSDMRRKIYHLQSQLFHPDHESGDLVLMQLLNEAWEPYK